jgi:hypothetical protein
MEDLLRLSKVSEALIFTDCKYTLSLMNWREMPCFLLARL